MRSIRVFVVYSHLIHKCIHNIQALFLLYASFSILDQARLTALSHPPSMSNSCQLTAIPCVTLGWAILGPEFVVFGSLFPFSFLIIC